MRDAVTALSPFHFYLEPPEVRDHPSELRRAPDPGRHRSWRNLKRSLSVFAALALITLARTSGPGAQEPDPVDPNEEERPDPNPNQSAEAQHSEEGTAKTPYREQIVVTATRIETSTDRVGSSISVITSDELERNQYRLLEDALRSVPGLDLRRNGGPGTNTSLFLRGADSDHTLVLIDGIELNDPSSPSRAPFINHLTPDNVERIEVLRGPQSTLYGSDAIGGVINVLTKRGGGEPSFSFWAEGGSFDTVAEGLALEGGSGAFGYSLSSSHVGSRSFSAQSEGSEADPYRNTSVAGRFSFDLTERATIDLFLRHLDAEIEFDGFSSEKGNQINVGQTLLKAESRFSSTGGRWEQRLSFQSARHERDTESSSPSLVRGRLFSASWQNDLRLGGFHTLTIGAEGEREEAEFSSLDDDADTVSLYTQYQFDRGGRSFGTVGLRADDHSLFGSEVTYRLTAGYRPRLGDTILRASVGTGFKAPSLSQLNESAFAGNPELEAETSRGFDAGIEQALADGKATYSLAYFQNGIDDLIVAIFDSGSGAFLNFNVDEARARGAEFFFRLRPTPLLEISGSYTYTRTRAIGTPAGFGLSDGSRLLRRPDHKAALDIHLPFPGKRLGVTLGALYVGKRDDLDPETFVTVQADDYLTVQLTGSYRLTDSVHIFGRIHNIFDRQYEDVLGFSTAGFSAYGGFKFAL